MKLISLITEGRRASLERRTSEGRRGNGGEGRRKEDGGTGDVCLERRFCIREAATCVYSKKTYYMYMYV